MKIAEVESLVIGGEQFVRITTDSGLVDLFGHLQGVGLIGSAPAKAVSP